MVLFVEHAGSSVFLNITWKEIIHCWHTIYIRRFRLWLHTKAILHVEPIVNQWDPFFTFCSILQEKQQLITLSEYVWLDVSTSAGFTKVLNNALIISSGSDDSIGMLHICHLSSPGTISGKLQTMSWALIPSVMAWMRYWNLLSFFISESSCMHFNWLQNPNHSFTSPLNFLSSIFGNLRHSLCAWLSAMKFSFLSPTSGKLNPSIFHWVTSSFFLCSSTVKYSALHVSSSPSCIRISSIFMSATTNLHPNLSNFLNLQ